MVKKWSSDPNKLVEAEKPNNCIGVDLIGRNWLLLTRLSRMGFVSQDALKIVKAMEKGVLVDDEPLNMKQIEKYGKKVLKKIK
jgi:hypothetical protein